MELCERYLHYMSALCEGTMPAPPELALTADTTEERAAQLQSALKSMSVPDFVRLCAKSAGDELDEAIFNHFSEEDFSRALLQMLTAAAEPEQPEPKAPERPSEPETRPEPVQVAEQPPEPAKQPATVKAAPAPAVQSAPAPHAVDRAERHGHPSLFQRLHDWLRR